MFREFFQLWKKAGLLNEALEETEKMLLVAKNMFSFSLRVLMDKEKEKEDIYKIDRELNKLQRNVRRKILEHLSINPQQDVTSCLVLITIVIDIERIGDYSKNLIELSHKYPQRLKGKYIERIREIEKDIGELFDRTISAFKNADIDLAKQIMERHARIAVHCEKVVEDLIEDTEVSSRMGIIYALLARYLKRVSAHLKNIASGVVNPFHRLGYKPKKME
ncbi:MAG TPA: Na/Pi cotransporter family protein [Candidatus Aerophobetes bacterium]|uniref:Na/Pi cotransporter family protein n=1 Tax=Aerophobetes bacterium TaxID=2030807 RepID=A0A7C1RAF2_UNCAE|nr:Na/Pi cotransporter family protein [Candidatus Aerophobetes bacterium]